jgi:hypothetical protein
MRILPEHRSFLKLKSGVVIQSRESRLKNIGTSSSGNPRTARRSRDPDRIRLPLWRRSRPQRQTRDFFNSLLGVRRRHQSLQSLAGRGARPHLATRYSIAAIVSRAKRARAVARRFRASVSAELAPCFRAFLLPFRAPPPAPCIRQTLCPRTEGARHWNPLLFDLAWHLGARRISKSMGLFLRFFVRPYPLGGRVDVADDRLPALRNVDVLHNNALLSASPVVLQRRHLSRIGPRQLRQDVRRRTCCAMFSTRFRRRAKVIASSWVAIIWAISIASASSRGRIAAIPAIIAFVAFVGPCARFRRLNNLA